MAQPAQELTGKHAEIRISGVKVIDAYDVVVEIINTFFEPRPFGQVWKKRIPDEADFSASAKKYALVSNIGQALALAASTQAAGEARMPATIDLYQTEGDANSKVFSGPIWVEKGTFTMPSGALIDEDISFVAADEPTFVYGYTI